MPERTKITICNNTLELVFMAMLRNGGDSLLWQLVQYCNRYVIVSDSRAWFLYYLEASVIGGLYALLELTQMQIGNKE